MEPLGSLDDPTDGIGALRTLLESARHLAGELVADPLVGRLLWLFARMPGEDRSMLLEVLEREVGLRLATQNGGDTITGVAVRFNPNARLYVRTFEKVDARLPLDHDELVFSTVRSTRLMEMAAAPAVHPAWCAATREAFGLVSPATRGTVRRVLSELLEMVDQADRDGAA